MRIAPTTMDIMTHRHELVPGQTVPLFELKPPVFEGVDFVIKRVFDVVVASVLLVRAVAGAARDRGRDQADLAGPGAVPQPRARASAAQPFDCLKFRTMHTDAEQRQEELEEHERGERRAVQDPPRPARHAGRRVAAPLQPRRAAAARERAARRDVDGRARGRCRCATTTGSRTGTASATSCCPGITGLWQVSGRAELDFDELVRLDFLYLERWSVFLDLSIVLKTLPAVLRRRGAVLSADSTTRSGPRVPAERPLDAARSRGRCERLARASSRGCSTSAAVTGGSRRRARRAGAEVTGGRPLGDGARARARAAHPELEFVQPAATARLPFARRRVRCGRLRRTCSSTSPTRSA